LLADTRTLVVLDNASSADQVRPLLPGSPTCLVVVTSRDRLAGLVVKEGARLLSLDVLPPEEAIDLLGRIAGADRVAAQRDEAARIVRLCGYLPLAVRVAATQLAIRPNQSLRSLSDRLADEKSRLQHLRVGDVEVRSTLAIGYSRLLADERRAFRLLGTLRFADIPAWVVATLAECDLTTAEQLAERLIDVGLLDSADEDAAGQFRYRLHDLLRLLARERTEQEDSASQRNAAVESVLAAHLSAAKLAVLQLQRRASATQPPGSDGMSSLERLGVRRSIAADAAVWLRVELENLTLAVEQACDAGQWAIACELAVTLTDYYDTQSLWEQWERSHTRALAAARHMGDRALEADILWRLGRRYRYGRPDDALGAYDACIRLYRELGDRQGEGCALLEVGVVHREQGRLAEARSAYADCLATFVELGDRRREAYTLRRLAFVETDQASIVDAIAHFQQCLVILEEFDDVPWTARTLRGLSIAYRLLGRYAEAEDSARRALEAFRATSDERGAGYALLDLGGIRAEQGRHDEASELLSDCLTRFRAASDGRGEAYALLDLSSVQACQGQFELAVSNAKRARSLCTAIRDERGLAWADLCMADLLREQDDLGGAASIYSLCFPVFRELGDQVGMAHSLLRRGIVELRRGDVEAAYSSWRGAKPLFDAAHMPESGELGDWLVRSPSEESMRGRIGRLRCMVDPRQENP
jgi:tetratricopeptide (TPR) repeat protein